MNYQTPVDTFMRINRKLAVEEYFKPMNAMYEELSFDDYNALFGVDYSEFKKINKKDLTEKNGSGMLK